MHLQQVFGPNITQKKLYDDAITPIVDEVRRACLFPPT